MTIVIVPLLLPTLFDKRGIFTCGYSKPSHFFVIMFICLVYLINLFDICCTSNLLSKPIQLIFQSTPKWCHTKWRHQPSRLHKDIVILLNKKLVEIHNQSKFQVAILWHKCSATLKRLGTPGLVNKFEFCYESHPAHPNPSLSSPFARLVYDPHLV